MVPFGTTLRKLRLRAGFGLRRFAELIDEAPSNLSAIENGRRPPWAGAERQREVADALGLAEGSPEFAEFFDAAAQGRNLPADLQHVARRRLVPALLRTINNRQLTDDEIADLIARIERRHGGETGEFA
ncbi:MAG: helix-turn-helix transcriptional regulator [Planctomycetota bacterium]